MPDFRPDNHWWMRYALLLLGFLFLLINHLSILMGDPWLIPSFLRLY